MEIILNFLREFFSLLGELLIGYVTNGFFFAALHGYVVTRVVYSLVTTFRKETEALRSWRPKTDESYEANEGGEITKALDDFVSQSAEQGRKGILISLTDYSDRLDSIVDGLIAQLHDRTNLFILIGIAGTLFGVFEFAFKVQEVLGTTSNNQIEEVGKILSASMAKAFPVGFMGLLLMFIFQQWAGTAENRLRGALSEAANRAIRSRKTVATEIEVVQQAANQIKESMEFTATRIQEALEPLKNLQATLTEGLQPVVKEFGNRLDQSLDLVKEQFHSLQTATGGIQTAVGSVQAGVSSLERAAGSLEHLLKDAPAVLEKINTIQERQVLSLKEFDKVLLAHLGQAEQVNEGISAATRELSSLPQALIDHTKGALEAIRTESVSEWQKMLSELQGRLGDDYSNMITNVSAQATEVKASVMVVSQQLNEVASNAKVALGDLSAMPDSILKGVDESFAKLTDQCFVTWKETSNQFGKNVENLYISYVRGISEEASKIKKSLDGVQETWGRLADNSTTLIQDSIRTLVKEAKAEIEDSLRSLDNLLASRIPEVSGEVEKFSRGMEGLLHNTRDVQREYTAWLDNARNAQESIREINNYLLEALNKLRQGQAGGDGHDIAGLLSSNIGELRETNSLLGEIRSRIPDSGNGIDSKLQESKDLLQKINKGIDTIANKKSPVVKVFEKFPWLRGRNSHG